MLPFEPRSIPFLYQDDNLIAVEKPEGLASIPEHNREKENLLDILSLKLGKKLYTVHRLDKEVSGAILFALNPQTHQRLNDMFSKGDVKKTYTALLHGVVGVDGGRIEKPIRQFGSGRMGIDPVKGKPSVTDYAVQKRWADSTLVSVHPLTGRRHQIRVHFYSLGHPVVGDAIYGDPLIQKKYPRLMLHASRLELILPSGKGLDVQSPLPPTFIIPV